jgi:hypothetical protein
VGQATPAGRVGGAHRVRAGTARPVTANAARGPASPRFRGRGPARSAAPGRRPGPVPSALTPGAGRSRPPPRGRTPPRTSPGPGQLTGRVDHRRHQQRRDGAVRRRHATGDGVQRHRGAREQPRPPYRPCRRIARVAVSPVWPYRPCGRIARVAVSPVWPYRPCGRIARVAVSPVPPYRPCRRIARAAEGAVCAPRPVHTREGADGPTGRPTLRVQTRAPPVIHTPAPSCSPGSRASTRAQRPRRWEADPGHPGIVPDPYRAQTAPNICVQ